MRSSSHLHLSMHTMVAGVKVIFPGGFKDMGMSE